MNSSIGVVVADDHPLLRDGVIRTLQSQTGIDVLGEAEDAMSAVEQCTTCRPDIALIDISMPGGGIEAARQIAALNTPPRVVMLTVSEEEDDVVDALKAGASGYVLKGVNAEELVSIVRSVHAGESYIPPSLAAQVLMSINNPSAAPVPDSDLLDTLTSRETDILKLVATGKSNKEIALSLDLQEKTIKHHMTSILQKLQVRNRVEAAVKANDVWKV
ncbi:MAG: response regulator [Rhizobiaceae bacterium]